VGGQIDDAVIDALEIGWDETNAKPYVANVPPDARVIRDFIDQRFWEHHIEFFFPGVLEQIGRISNEQGFWFASDLEPDEQSFEGVQISDPLDTIKLSNGAFDRLMSRYYRVVLDHAEGMRLPITQEVWWGAFARAVPQIEARARMR
jgi:hypothetical protein